MIQKIRVVFRHSLLHAVFIALLGVLVYSNTFTSPFVFDDQAYIVKNPIITGSGYIFDIKRAEGLQLDENVRQTISTRYLGYLSFAINHWMHGLDVWGYHAINLLIHIVNGMLVYALVCTTLRTPFMEGTVLARSGTEVALFCALLFVVHPLQTEAVTYITQRFASMAAMFYLLSLVFYARARLSKRILRAVLLYLFSVFFAVFAMKSKETAFTFPLAAALYEVCFLRGSVRKRLLMLVPLFLTMLIVPLSLMDAGLPFWDAVASATMTRGDITRHAYLATETRVVITYLRLLAFPINQNLDYDYPLYESLAGPGLALSVFIVLALICGASYLVYASKRHSPELRLVAFGVLWFFTTISVESSIMPLADLIFEHRAYLPSVGIILSAVTAVYYLARKGRGIFGYLTAAFLALVAIFALAAYHRNSVWQSEIALWGDAAGKSPGKARPHNNLGIAYLVFGEMEKAVVEFQKTIAIDPGFLKAYKNLETVYLKRPEMFETYAPLGSYYIKEGRHEKALEIFKKIVIRNPGFAGAHVKLANEYDAVGEMEKAIEHYKIALKLDPRYTEAYYNLALVYQRHERLKEAEAQFLNTLRLDPNFAQAHNNLGLVYEALGQRESAIEHLFAATRLDPDLAEAHFNLGVVYIRAGRLGEGREELLAVLRIVPDDADAINLYYRSFY